MTENLKTGAGIVETYGQAMEELWFNSRQLTQAIDAAITEARREAFQEAAAMAKKLENEWIDPSGKLACNSLANNIMAKANEVTA